MERTFTKEEVLQMIDDAMRCVKGGDDYPAFGTEQDKEFQIYGAGISFIRGWMETGMTYRITGEFPIFDPEETDEDYDNDGWIPCEEELSSQEMEDLGMSY